MTRVLLSAATLSVALVGACFGSRGTDSISSEGQLARASVARAVSSIGLDVWPQTSHS